MQSNKLLITTMLFIIFFLFLVLVIGYENKIDELEEKNNNMKKICTMVE